MERKVVCLTIVAVSVMSVSLFAGCLSPFHNCPNCGCGSVGMNIRETEKPHYMLNGTDLAHKDALMDAHFWLEFVVDNETEKKWSMSYQSVVVNDTTVPYLIFDIVDILPKDISPKVQITEGSWRPFTLSIRTDSMDPYLSTKTFFNGSNIITGKIFFDGGRDIINITIDDGNGVAKATNKKTGHINSSIAITAPGWIINIEFRNPILCVG